MVTDTVYNIPGEHATLRRPFPFLFLDVPGSENSERVLLLTVLPSRFELTSLWLQTQNFCYLTEQLPIVKCITYIKLKNAKSRYLRVLQSCKVHQRCKGDAT